MEKQKRTEKKKGKTCHNSMVSNEIPKNGMLSEISLKNELLEAQVQSLLSQLAKADQRYKEMQNKCNHLQKENKAQRKKTQEKELAHLEKKRLEGEEDLAFSDDLLKCLFIQTQYLEAGNIKLFPTFN